MSNKYYFSIPVSGVEYYEVVAESEDEAIKLLSEDTNTYKVEDDIEFTCGISKGYLDSVDYGVSE